MSYDYVLFREVAPGPMDSWPAVPPEPMGTADEVKARLGTLFPGASWELSHGAWFGTATRAPEMGFQLTPDDDGMCRSLTVRRITRAEVQDLCRALGLVAVDAQRVELIRP